jgi:predicted nucleic acid-binding protein
MDLTAALSAARYTQSPGLSTPETYRSRDRAPSSHPLIYAEVSVGYRTIEELEELLPAADYEREPLPYLAGFAAGKAFLRYRRSGGEKRSPMPDFYIGAHAAVTGYRLLTRGVRRYRTYFPTIDIIAPPQAEDETT